MSTIILLLLAISVSLTTGVSTYQVQVDGVDHNLTLCDNTAYNKYVSYIGYITSVLYTNALHKLH